MPETETKIRERDRAPRRDIQLNDDRPPTKLNKLSLGILWKLPAITKELYEELQIESYIYPHKRPRTEIDRLQKGLKKDLYKPCKEFLKKYPFFLEKLKKYKNCSTYRWERWLRWYNLNEFLKEEVPNNLEDMINGEPYLLLQREYQLKLIAKYIQKIANGEITEDEGLKKMDEICEKILSTEHN